MVHKKRTHAPRPKHSAVHENAAIPLLESDQSLVSVQKSKKDATAVVGGEKNVVSPSLASIKLECERALTALRRGNHTKALRLIKELCSKHESSPHAALIHRVQGSVYVKVALLIDDPNTKRRHFNNAIESARRAVSLCPNSIEFAQFYANLLYEAANEAKEYEEVVQECERALAIENPIDPAKQSLLEESQQKDETPRARIDHVRSDLRSLIQKSNIATISTWVKNIGSGEETIRLIPIRRLPEDPMDQARRSNQIKKANKTPEERRKEIEVRVAAARLLQQKSETVKMHNDGEKALDLTEESMQRIGERRKSGNARKNPSATERRDRVQSYWNSLTLVRKKELLRIAISDLKAHFSASKDRLAIEVLSEALSFAETSKDWMFWTCCRCNKKFIDSVSHNYHAEHEHIGTLRPKLQSVLPQTVENEWVEMLLNCSWEPLDVSATVDMLDKLSGSQRQGPRDEKHSGYNTEECFLDEKHPRDNTDERYPRDNTDECFVDEKHPRGTEECFLDEKHPRDNTEKCFVDEKHPGDTEECFLDEKHPRDNTEESKYGCSEVFCSEDNGDSTPRKKKFGDIPNTDMVESRLCDKISDIELMDCDENYDTKNCFLPDKWPLSDDPHRAKLLEKISSVFQKLIKSKCLASSQLSKVVHFAAEELQGLAFGSQLSSFNVDQIPLCICFLGAEQLKEVLKFLQELLHCCGLGRYSEKISARDGASNSSQGFDDLEKLVFSEDGSCLLFDQRFLPCRFTRSSCPDIVSIDRTAHVLSSNQNQNGAELDPEALLSWIFEGPSSAEQLVSWTCAREEKAQRGIEILRFLEKELNDLQCLCERKYEHLSYEEALQVVEDIFLEEGKRRDQATEFVLQSYDSVLRKRREELIESDNDVTIFGYRSELNAISNVLKEAESLNVNRFGLEESNSGGTSQLGDIESGEEDEWKLKDYIHQVDSCVEVALQRQKECVSIELCKIDARIMGVVARMQQLKVKLGHACAQDYRSILVTLLKSYMRTHLEDLATKDATEKSDAASEAFLAELARDSKNSSGGGNGCSKHTHEKVKDKKKNREYRKTKGSKPTSGNELHLLRYQTMEDISFAVTCDGENQGDETVGNGDSFNEQDKEYRRRIELESEERKLEETLEFQRRMENEAKLKHLAEQTKRTAKTCPQSVDAVMKSDTCSKYRDNGQLINGQLKSSKRKEFPDSLGSLPKISTEEMSQRTVTPEDSTLVSTQYTGRRGRRQNDSKLIDGNFQSASEEKENTEVGEPIALRSSHGVNGPADSGTKTLKQLHVENHDEERFQADLKKAVQQSLDTFHAHKKLPLLPSSGNGQRVFPKAGTLGNANSIGDVNKVDVYGTGLKNEVGEYNCFLNVIIQSLWHLGRFRDEFLRTSSEHVHVGDPCVTCALYDIFTALNTASTEACSKTVAPTSLRIALSNLYPDSSFFQEGQMNDASEVLGVIFDCLHQSFTSASGVSDTESADSSCMGTWDCSNGACIVHSLFGMDIFEQMNCYNCGLESRHLKYTSFFHNINASALRTMKVMSPESSFDALLNLVEMNYQLSCYSEVDECRKLNCIHHILSTPPHVFTTVLGWQNTCESVGDITATLSALSTEVDISVLYHGLAPKNKHCLISMVCYYGQHYHCFAYSCDHGKWVMYDDKTVKVIGDWDDVLVTCERGHLQPQVLFFEAVK